MVALQDRSAMVPTEDSIEALLDYLVLPLLPIRESPGEAPTDHQQMMVAKQMHAVATLYNYYHRKQFPDLKVLDFESFWKICCISKPALFMYLRYMNRCGEDSENLNSQLSIAEKMVMDACNICIGLDSLKDDPIMDGWPISKIAIFLVDSTKEKCLLQFCSITQGVWSLVEKVLEAPHENDSPENESCKSGEMLEQLAFSAVEEETGISHLDLSILERHLTYSLSHVRTSAQLYIMTYVRGLNEEFPELAIKDVMKSLEGPLIKKDLTCEVTSVVEHYHLLPYIEIISSWLSRRSTGGDSLDLPMHTVNEKDCSLHLDGIPSTDDHGSNGLMLHFQNRKPSKSENIEMNIQDLPAVNDLSGASRRLDNRCDSPCVKRNDPSIMKNETMNDKPMQNEEDENVLNIKKDRWKDATVTYNRRVGRLSRVPNSSKIVNPEHPSVPERMPTIRDQTDSEMSGSSKQNLNVKVNEMMKTDSEIIKNINDLAADNGSFIATSRSQSTADGFQVESDDRITMKDQEMKEKVQQNGKTEEAGLSKKCIEDAITHKEDSSDNCKKDAITCEGNALPTNYEQASYIQDSCGPIVTSDAYVDEGKTSGHNVTSVSGGGFEEQAGVVDSVKYMATCLVEETTSSSGANEDGYSLNGLPLIPMQFGADDHQTTYRVMASAQKDLLEASLRGFERKRDELCQERRVLEDEIARCEMNIQRIIEGKENNLAMNIESIIEALNSFCSEPLQICMDLSEKQSLPQIIKRRKLSEAILTSENQCQELDDICHKNGWVLPTYSVFPSLEECKITGMFKAMVTVNGTGFKCKSSGDLKSSPREARESAANSMLNTLRMWQAEQ